MDIFTFICSFIISVIVTTCIIRFFKIFKNESLPTTQDHNWIIDYVDSKNKKKNNV